MCCEEIVEKVGDNDLITLGGRKILPRIFSKKMILSLYSSSELSFIHVR
jgi:hypothetical protein